MWPRLDTKKKVLVALVIINVIAIGLSEIGALVERTIRPQKKFQTSANRLAEQKEFQTSANRLAATPEKSMTLYTFDKDTDGRGTCVGACAVDWPPFTDGIDWYRLGEPTPWSRVARDDGSKMWAYKGRPVYFFKNDYAPGDVNGDGVDGVWHVVHLDHLP
jgi:predicted lipoprotein with Yx(FWY)xxD motif